MRTLRLVRNLATLSVATATLFALPGLASAQRGVGAPQADPLAGKIVNLKVEVAPEAKGGRAARTVLGSGSILAQKSRMAP